MRMRDGELEMLEPEGGKPGRRKKEVRDQRKTRRGEERRGGYICGGKMKADSGRRDYVTH